MVHQLDVGEISGLESSGDIHLFCRQNHQWDATQYNILQVALQPIAFSDRDLAEVFYSGVEVI